MNKEKREHKQRITVNITLKGIRLLDEQTEVRLIIKLFKAKTLIVEKGIY